MDISFTSHVKKVTNSSEVWKHPTLPTRLMKLHDLKLLCSIKLKWDYWRLGTRNQDPGSLISFSSTTFNTQCRRNIEHTVQQEACGMTYPSCHLSTRRLEIVFTVFYWHNLLHAYYPWLTWTAWQSYNIFIFEALCKLSAAGIFFCHWNQLIRCFDSILQNFGPHGTRPNIVKSQITIHLLKKMLVHVDI
jgi:hypothetical protein